MAWLREGAARLAEVLESAPDDLDALTFLADSPPPKQFWARRQCHETTIHAVDALAASLRRRPRARDTWIGRELALDGIDELLTGFVPRPRSRLRSPDPLTLAIEADDADASWLVTVHERPPVTLRGARDADADIEIRGPAVALYLTLWNRSDELSGDALDLWAEGARVTWA